MIDVELKGMDAAMEDDLMGEVTDNPYDRYSEPLHFSAWYSGYNYYMNNKDQDPRDEPEPRP